MPETDDKVVDVPGVGKVSFPGYMSDDEISRHIIGQLNPRLASPSVRPLGASAAEKNMDYDANAPAPGSVSDFLSNRPLPGVVGGTAYDAAQFEKNHAATVAQGGHELFGTPTPSEIAAGAQDNADRRYGGVSKILRGTAGALTPVALPIALINPVSTALALTGSSVGSSVAGKYAKATGMGPGSHALLEDIGSFLGGGAGIKAPIPIRAVLSRAARQIEFAQQSELMGGPGGSMPPVKATELAPKIVKDLMEVPIVKKWYAAKAAAKDASAQAEVGEIPQRPLGPAAAQPTAPAEELPSVAPVPRLQQPLAPPEAQPPSWRQPSPGGVGATGYPSSYGRGLGSEAPALFENPEQGGYLDEDNVAALVKAIKAGVDLPPIVARENGQIIGGHHRFEAYKQAGAQPKAVQVPESLYQQQRSAGMPLDEIEYAAEQPWREQRYAANAPKSINTTMPPEALGTAQELANSLMPGRAQGSGVSTIKADASAPVPRGTIPQARFDRGQNADLISKMIKENPDELGYIDISKLGPKSGEWDTFQSLADHLYDTKLEIPSTAKARVKLRDALVERLKGVAQP